MFKVLTVLFLFPTLCWGAPKSWRQAQTGSMTVYSNASESRTESLIQELRDAEAAFQLLFPKLKGDADRPLRVIVCNDWKSLEALVPLYEGKPKKLGGMFSQDFEGAFMLIDSSDGFESARHIVYHEYIHFLTAQRDFYMPPWLGEGLAELFATIETDRKKGVVRVGNALEVRAQTIRSERLMPFDRFFAVTRGSPEYNSSNHGRGVFYSQSWLLLHYLQMGQHDIERASVLEFLGLAVSKPFFSEAEFEAALGFGYKELEKRLTRYARSGRFNILGVALPDLVERPEVDLRAMSDGELDLLVGSIQLKTRGEKEAYAELSRAFEALPQSADAAAFLGYHAWLQDDFEDAVRYLKLALERGTESALTYLNYAHALLKSVNPKNNLGPNRYGLELSREALSALKKAREMSGAFSPALYYRFGEVLLGTRLDLEDQDFALLIEGLKAYPKDEQIAFYLALHLERSGQFETALKVVDRYSAMGLQGQALGNFNGLRKRLVEKMEKVGR